MRRIFTLFVLVVVALVFTTPVEAQFARANVQGEATDPDGLPLPGVAVTLRNDATGATRTVVTSVSGGYMVQGLVPGTYTITFALQGFQTVEQLGLELRVGQSPSVKVTMVLSTLEETVTVTALTPMIEVTSKEVGGSLTAREIEDLPSINRSFILFAALLPGVVARQGTGTLSADVIYVNGQDDNNNQFNIDGAANDDDQNGGNAGGQVRAAFEAMAEFQILTSQFDAEFGRTMGGVINAVTKSGTNEFHGVAFYYAQRSDWNTTPFFTERANISQPKVQFNGEGFTVGGPIIQDRTHFFVSFEHLAPNRPVVNDFSAIGRADASFATASENNVWNWVLKLDHQISDNNKFAARMLWEYQPQANAACGRCTQQNLTDEEDYDWTFVTSLDSVLSDTKFNNFRWSFTREDLDFAMKKVFETCDRSTPQSEFDCVSAFAPRLDYRNIRDGERGNQSRRRNNSIQFDDTLSLYMPDKKGDHDIRTGFHFSMKEVDRSAAGNANGRFRFRGNTLFDFNDTSTYPERFSILLGGSRGAGPTQDLPQTYVLGLFFQDDWQPIPNLTLNLGVRWDWESITEGDYNNIGPRLGFAWDPRGDGKTTVRAGAGRFYSRYLHGEWEDPFHFGPTDISGITRNWKDGNRDQADMILQMQLSGCTDLTCLRNFLRDSMLADIANVGFNTGPTVEGSGIGLRDQSYADTLSVGVEHELMSNLSIAVDVVRTDAKNQIVFASLNDFSNTFGRPQISIFNGEQRDFRTIFININAGVDASTTHTSLLM
ncbi:MAG: TonB-dependent receptor, partial [Acidobacteria bacterium]|nr:TonB-dependent receptor [Acidobacteriota bacterium]